MLEAAFKMKTFVSNNNKRVAIVRQILLKLQKKKTLKKYTENTEKIYRKEYTENKKSMYRKEYTENSIQKRYFDNIFFCFLMSFLCNLNKIFLAIATVLLFQHTKVFTLKMPSSM